jgi:hypothetical protein
MARKKRRPLDDTRKDMQILEDFLDNFTFGDTIDWFTIERETGIKMTNNGKNRFRRAMHNKHLVWRTLVGKGVQLSAPDTARSLADEGVVKVHKAVGKATERTQRLLHHHAGHMPGDDEQYIVRVRSHLGALATGCAEIRSREKPEPAPALPKASFRMRPSS